MSDREAAAVALVVGLGALCACAGPAPSAPPADVDAAVSDTAPAAESVAEPPFLERAREVGIDFVHFNGMSGEFFIAEVLGPGGALIDYDNDGDLDVFIVQGAMLGRDKDIREATFPPVGPLPPGDRLFRNLLGETGDLRFVDVTDDAGIVSTGYGMGVAAGDYDADGFVDLYVTNFGPNVLLRNDGDGTFTDVTDRSGTAEDRWSTSAAFFDYDGDGRLDLFVCNYVDFTLANHKACYSETSARDYCGPLSYQAYPNRLFRNLGDGTFDDVTATSRIARGYGGGLGVVCSDLDGDDRVDIYVANDKRANLYWVNLGDGTFRDDALLAGCALDADGRTEGSMGVDAGDFDADGDQDLFVTNLSDETATLYRNDGTGLFDDATVEAGLAAPSLTFTGFGTAWVDYDNDGWLDIIVVNGEIKTIEALAARGDPYPLHQTKQIYRNRGDGHFEEITAQAGDAFRLSEVGRGAAFGDVDNDGDTDVLVLNNNGPARLLVNQVGNRNSWVGVRMMDRDGRLDVPNTRVEIVRRDGSSLWREVRTAASYLSANDPRVLVGIGADSEIRSVRARWPGGDVEEWSDVPVGRYTTLRRGTGRPGRE